MVTRRISKRSVGLITLGCVLFIVAPANRVTSVPVPSPTVSPTPSPTPKVKRPNQVRRFFSSISDKITGVFRRSNPPGCYLPPCVNLNSSSSSIAICPAGQGSFNPSCSSSSEVTLTAGVEGAEENELLYTWAVTAGRLRGEGSKVVWDLSGVAEGTYTASVELNAGNQHTATASTSVTVSQCSDCLYIDIFCPVISVSCPSVVDSKQPVVFEATVFGADPELKLSYTWSVTAGKIISGQGTKKIEVDASNIRGQSMTATVTVGGIDPRCIGNTASCSVEEVKPQQH